jgi:hypothetical protein
MRRQVASTLRSASLTQQRLELSEEQLDRIKVRAIGRQEEELGAGGSAAGPRHRYGRRTACEPKPLNPHSLRSPEPSGS